MKFLGNSLTNFSLSSTVSAGREVVNGGKKSDYVQLLSY